LQFPSGVLKTKSKALASMLVLRQDCKHNPRPKAWLVSSSACKHRLRTVRTVVRTKLTERSNVWRPAGSTFLTAILHVNTRLTLKFWAVASSLAVLDPAALASNLKLYHHVARHFNIPRVTFDYQASIWSNARHFEGSNLRTTSTLET
jgi:hypothetical protein